MKRQRLIKKPNIKLNKKITKISQQKFIKPITGRALFIKIKMKEGFTRNQAVDKWKKLPLETKELFRKWGQGEPTSGTLRSAPTSTIVLKSEPVRVTFSSGCQSLQYMHKMRKN
jgi:hypothetical protein